MYISSRFWNKLDNKMLSSFKPLRLSITIKTPIIRCLVNKTKSFQLPKNEIRLGQATSFNYSTNPRPDKSYDAVIVGGG